MRKRKKGERGGGGELFEFCDFVVRKVDGFVIILLFWGKKRKRKKRERGEFFEKRKERKEKTDLCDSQIFDGRDLVA